MTTTEQTPRELPERFSCVTTKPKDGNMRSAAGGDYVRYSDYAALATRLAESEARAEALKMLGVKRVRAVKAVPYLPELDFSISAYVAPFQAPQPRWRNAP